MTTRVSDYFDLGATQAALEFVDVPVDRDVPLFIDPQAFQAISSTWAAECVALIQDFFSEVIAAVKAGRDDRAKSLLAALREPQETRLGLSRGSARGSGIGEDLAESIWTALSTSRAARSGRLQDLEDAALFVEGIGPDRISDLATNIVRGPLVQFTQDACRYYGIPLTAGVNAGRVWSRQSKRFEPHTADLPILPSGPLLLVPRAVVRHRLGFDAQTYYTHYISTFIQQEELAANSALVETLKSGRKRVTKKRIREEYGQGKEVNLQVTGKNGALLDQYRRDSLRQQAPMPHDDLADASSSPRPDWASMLSAVTTTPLGEADEYHRAVQALLTALFYPWLDFPQREFQIHDGRKRIDITFTNVANDGFFHWMHAVHQTPCSMVMVECKNYTGDVGNPSFDQLAGRFSVQRGQLGFLCHRGFKDKALLENRAADTARDGRGYILVFDDQDLETLVNWRASGDEEKLHEFLTRKVHSLDA